MKAHAIYYDGELLGVITNPNNYPGGLIGLGESLSPDEGLFDATPIQIDKAILKNIKEKKAPECYNGCGNEATEDGECQKCKDIN